MTLHEYMSQNRKFAVMENPMEKQKQERTVIHLQRGEDHFYFGCLAAIYERFSKEEVGISYGSLRNYGLSAEKPYINKQVIIRKGILITIPKKNINY